VDLWWIQDNNRRFKENEYIERLVKTLLWIYGGYKIIIGGSKKIGEYIKKIYSEEGKRAFDAKFMSGIYEKPFTVVTMNINEIPSAKEKSILLGGHLEGCRSDLILGQVIEKLVQL